MVKTMKDRRKRKAVGACVSVGRIEVSEKASIMVFFGGAVGRTQL